MKRIVKDKRIFSLYVIVIMGLFFGLTYALESASLAFNVNTALISVDETAYGSTTFDTSNLDFRPILDTEVETNTDNVIKTEFTVGGAETNNADNIIYDIALNDLNVSCELLSPYIKWKLLKNGTEISNGSLDYEFDTIVDGRLVLTTIQQDLADYSADQTNYDDYTFYMWFSDSCQNEDISSCSSAVDQTALLNKSLIGKVEVELYTESKKELVRNPSDTLDTNTCGTTYEITYSYEGGSGDETSKVVISNGTYGTLPTPTRSGYEFVGWYTEANGGGTKVEEDTVVDLTEDISLFAFWRQIELLVTFEPSGGTVSPETMTVTYGEAYGELPTPTRSGYEFVGWYTEANGGGTKVEEDIVVDLTEDISLFAFWRQVQFLVTFEPSGGAVSPETMTVTYGEAYGELPTPTRSGYTFNGWYTEENGGGSQVVSTDIVDAEGDYTLYAKWTANVYNIKYDYENDIYNQSTVSWEYHGASTINPSNTSDGNPIVAVYSNANQWTGMRIPLTTMKKTNTNYELSVDAIRYASIGGTLRVYAPTYDSAGSTLNYNHGINMTDDNLPLETWTTYSYSFNSGAYTTWNQIYIDYNTANIGPVYVGNISLDEYSTASLDYGSTYGTLPTPTRAGFTFEGWYTEPDGAGTKITSTSQVSIAEDHTLYANWTADSYTFSASTSSVTSGNTSDLVVLPRPTKTGYTFNGWTKSTSYGSITKFGTGMFNDDTFASSVNSMSVYNNSGGGTVVHSRVAKSSDNPMSNTSYMMQITTSGTASPGLGGFYQGTTSKANGVFYHVIVAKIPVGYKIYQGNNAVGDGGTFNWLTPREGTGEWETYIYRANNGSSGTFSTFGHVYINGTAATSSSPVTWYVAYANMFDATSGTDVENASQLFTFGRGDQSLTENWTKTHAVVTVNDGFGGTSTKYISSGGSETITLTKTGYTFKSFTASGCTVSGSTVTVSGTTDCTITANWTAVHNGATTYSSWSYSSRSVTVTANSGSNIAYYTYATDSTCSNASANASTSGYSSGQTKTYSNATYYCAKTCGTATNADGTTRCSAATRYNLYSDTNPPTTPGYSQISSSPYTLTITANGCNSSRGNNYSFVKMFGAYSYSNSGEGNYAHSLSAYTYCSGYGTQTSNYTTYFTSSTWGTSCKTLKVNPSLTAWYLWWGRMTLRCYATGYEKTWKDTTSGLTAE